MTKVIGQYDDRDVSLMAVEQYFRQLRWSAPMSREEEAALLERVQRGKAERDRACPDAHVIEDARVARDRLVEGMQPLAIAMARRWLRRFRSMELLDLIQEASIGVLGAIEDYEPDKGYSWMACVSTQIHHVLWEARLKTDGIVRLSEKTVRKVGRVRACERELTNELGRTPTTAEVAQAAGLTEAQVTDVRFHAARQEVESLQGLLRDEEDAEDRHHFVSLFEQEVQADELRREQLLVVLHQAMETILSERERETLQMRYQQQLTYAEIGQRFGLAAGGGAVLSRERRAVQRLQRALRPECQQTPEEFYTIAQVAKLAGVPAQRAYGWVRQGKLTVYPAPVGYVGYRPGAATAKHVCAKAEVEAFLQQEVA